MNHLLLLAGLLMLIAMPATAQVVGEDGVIEWVYFSDPGEKPGFSAINFGTNKDLIFDFNFDGKDELITVSYDEMGNPKKYEAYSIVQDCTFFTIDLQGILIKLEALGISGVSPTDLKFGGALPWDVSNIDGSLEGIAPVLFGLGGGMLVWLPQTPGTTRFFAFPPSSFKVLNIADLNDDEVPDLIVLNKETNQVQVGANAAAGGN